MCQYYCHFVSKTQRVKLNDYSFLATSCESHLLLKKLKNLFVKCCSLGDNGRIFESNWSGSVYLHFFLVLFIHDLEDSKKLYFLVMKCYDKFVEERITIDQIYELTETHVNKLMPRTGDMLRFMKAVRNRKREEENQPEIPLKRARQSRSRDHSVGSLFWFHYSLC